MSLRVKKTYGHKTKTSDHSVKKKTEDEKENQSSNQGPKRKIISRKSLQKHPLSSKENPEMKFSCMGFWSKKLQDLENNKKKNKQSKLYEFSCSEESDPSYKIKKIPKPKKQQMHKRRQPVEPKYKKFLKNTKKVLQAEENIYKQAILKKEEFVNEDRKKLTDEHKNLRIPPGLQSVAWTSTPIVNKNNLVDQSNFLFLSPIIKEESRYSGNDDGNSSIKINGNADSQILLANLDQETPKIQTRLRRISCRRVLRSGKMLSK